MTGIGQANFLQALGWAVLDSLWQMALLWVVYQIIISILKPIKSSTKSSLASILLIGGFAWFIYTFISIFTSDTTADTFISSGIINTEGNAKLNNWLQQTLPAASILYLILLIFPLLLFFRNYRYVQIIRHYGLTKADVQWRMFVKKVASQMGIQKPIRVWLSELVSSPVTIGYLKPVILLPIAVINHLTPQQLEAVLLHELSHIRRYDYLVNLIINFIQTILYYNPFVKAFVKTVEREREKSCDEMVMQFQYNPHEYATALLILEKSNHLSKPLAIAAAGKKNDLLHRVELILGVHKKQVISFNRLGGLLAGLLCVIALNALMIMSKPVSGNRGLSFTQLPSPFYFFTGDNNETTEPSVVNGDSFVAEKQRPSVTNHLSKPEPVSRSKRIQDLFTPVEHTSDFVNVNYEPVAVPQLKKYQEEQVKEAMDASKKVLQDIQWKVVEKSIADVFTQLEKEQLKSTYQKELEKIDWNKWEDKLRLAYNNVDWEKTNDQLGRAINQIRLDSLQKVYTEVSGKLNIVQQELSENNLKGIPDTDITLKEIEKKKLEVQKTLNNLRALRNKKIIHL